MMEIPRGFFQRIADLREGLPLVMTDHITKLLREQNQSLYVVATGAGSSLLTELWNPPGASSFFVGGCFPYAPEETTDFLKFRPEKYCSQRTAIDLAMEACIRAAGEGRENPLGVAITAVVGSERQRRAGNRAHIAIVGNRGVVHTRLRLSMGTGQDVRQTHEAEIVEYAAAVLHMYLMAEPDKIPEDLGMDRLLAHPTFFKSEYRLGPDMNACYFPGTFNPLHEGHVVIRNEMAAQIGGEPTFLVCTTPVHKEPIGLLDCLKKVAMVRAVNGTIEFTAGDPLFVDKFRARPGSHFVVGADTMERMLDPKWGPDSQAVLEAIRTHNITMWVAARDGAGLQTLRKQGLIPVEYSTHFRSLHTNISMSSTAIRNGETV